MKKNSRIVNIDYEKNKTPWFYFIPLLLIAGFVPLIVHGKYIDLTGTTQALYWTGQNQLLDFFSYWKSRWVIYLTATALVIYIFLLITKKLPFKKEYKYYIPLAIYAFFVILSTIFAIDVPTALNGFVDMYQGIWVLLSYILLTFLTINFVNSERDVKLFLYAFVFLIIVEGLIGVGQYFGFDIFNTKFGNSLIIPSGINVDGGLNFNFGKHTIYGTLFNTNYVGSFATLMLPMAGVFLISAKTLKNRVVAGIALLLCLFTWIGCNSRAGYLGVAFALLFLLLILRKQVVNNWKILIFATTVAFIGIIGLNSISNGKIASQISNLNIFNELEILKNYEAPYTFEKLELDKNMVIIETSLQDMKIKVDEEKLYFLDGNNNELPMKIDDEGYYVVDDPSANYLRVQIAQKYPGFSVYTPWEILNMYISDEGIKYIGNSGKLIEPTIAKTSIFLNGLEQFGSNRGYIWGRSIPLMSKYFFGAGADNFPFTFPQNDILAKINLPNIESNTVIDKPHNMYLQIAINTGLISLLSLLTIWIIYIFSSIKLYWKLELNSFDKYIGLACLLSIIGYLVAGIFNDYIISVAPIFWAILGLGISINNKLKKKECNKFNN